MLILPNCRERLTADDFDFLIRTLARSPNESVSLARLLTDAGARDAILDGERLVKALGAHAGGDGESGPLRVSPQCYFYLLTRHVLKEHFDRTVCDYIASMLEAFSRTARLRSPADGAEGPVQYLSDMLLALRDAPPRTGFLIRVHVGNYALFITGLFPGAVARRRSRGAPGTRFYEELGRASYRVAAGDRVARQWKMDDVYGGLAEGFGKARAGLNRMAKTLLRIEPPRPLLGRQVGESWEPWKS